MSNITIAPVRTQGTEVPQIPLARVVGVELRKMIDTRSGFWLMSSIGITGLLTMVEGASLAEVVKALNAIGATPQDLLAILQAMKSAGALRAELEII